MDTKFILGIGLAIALVFAGVSVVTGFSKTPHASPPGPDRDVLYQVSTIDALMDGVFDGVLPVGELKKHGDFGIGTFDSLDGEMIVLDGAVYHAGADGQVTKASDNQTVPFATVTYFDPDMNTTTDHAMNLSEFSSRMTASLPTRNMVYAVRIHGTFPTMEVRAIPAQHKPYPTLTAASANQSVHFYTNTTGTIIGFYTPVFFRGLNVEGFHLHFLSDDHTTGGHVLDLTVPEGTRVEYDITQGFSMLLPTSGDFTGADLTKDVSADLAKVEK